MAEIFLRHLTRYSYRRAVGFGEHRLMLRPAEACDQQILSAELDIRPSPKSLAHVHDISGACVTVARFASRAAELSFESRIRLEHAPRPAFAGMESEIQPLSADLYRPEEKGELAAALAPRHEDPEGVVTAWARRFVRRRGATPLPSLLAEMSAAIRADFRYQRRLTEGPRPPAQTLELGEGSCRDFAVLYMEAARRLGLAARFVSGYVYDPMRLGGTVRGGGHTHAWARVYLPACGWVDVDPTGGTVGGAGLIRVAETCDPAHASPLHGAFFGKAADFLSMEVEVEIGAPPQSFPLARRARAA